MPYSQRLPDKPATSPAPSSKVAQRLLVHAKLCRQMACASLNEAIGEQLLNLASECVREAAEILAAERLSARQDSGSGNMATSARVSA